MFTQKQIREGEMFVTKAIEERTFSVNTNANPMQFDKTDVGKTILLSDGVVYEIPEIENFILHLINQNGSDSSTIKLTGSICSYYILTPSGYVSAEEFDGAEIAVVNAELTVYCSSLGRPIVRGTAETVTPVV